MTTFRYSLLPALVLSVVVGETSAATQDRQSADTCGNIDPFVTRECVDHRISQKEQQLAQLYSKALAAVRRSFAKYGDHDNRTDPKYLEQSQAQWRSFVENDCKVRAAFGGGSNSSISDRETACHEAALDRRIEFLNQLADGSFGTS